MTKKSTDKLNLKELFRAIFKVLKISFSISKLAISFKLISTILDSVFPLLTAYFAAQTTTKIAEAFSGVAGAQQAALWYVLLTAILGLLTAAQSSISNYVDQMVRFRVEAEVSDMLYERFTALEFWRYDDTETADLYSKAKDFTSFFTYVFDRIAQIFQSVFGAATAIIGLILVSPWMSLAILVAIIPGLLIQLKLSRLQVEHWRGNTTLRRKQGFIEYQMMDPKNIIEIRLSGMVKKILAMRVDFRNRDQGDRLQFERQFIGWRIASDVLAALTELGSLAWVIVQIGQRHMPIGQFVYVQQLVSRALGSANNFTNQLGAMDEDLAKLNDYSQFMSLAVMDGGIASLDLPIRSIVLKDVSFTYPSSGKQVLKNINLTITAGSHVAIVGENGAGKSTLIKIILGLYQPTSGAVYVNDRPLEDYNIADWHKQLSVLMQEFIAYSFATIGENITFGDVGRRFSQKRLERALRDAEANEVVSKLPNKLNTPAATWFDEEDGVQLSGGQWQRIALARSFYRDAPIIILDEPTSAIDALAEAAIFDRLFSDENKSTVITISHRLTTIESADHIYVLKNGQIVQQGTHADLSGQAGEYVKMFRRQLKLKN